MKKSIIFAAVGLFLMAGAVFAASEVQQSETSQSTVVEMPDKDPKAQEAEKSSKKSCCSDKKSEGKSCCSKGESSCKGEKKSCDGSKHTSGKACDSKSETKATTETKTNCPKTKCQ